MAFVDNQQVIDVVAASLSVDVVAPLRPCPDCGAETRAHGEAPHYDESERICSAANCRKVQPAPNEVVRRGTNDPRPRFPCAECGRETKPYRAGCSGQTRQRVCSRATCRKIFSA